MFIPFAKLDDIATGYNLNECLQSNSNYWSPLLSLLSIDNK